MLNGNVSEGITLELSYQVVHIISKIQFASYENPKEKCDSFKEGSWDVTNNTFLVEKVCIDMKKVVIKSSIKLGENQPKHL